jgi:methionine sulfoxide reductase heme-binding subunit
MDIKNTPIQHTIVGIFSLVLVFILKLLLEVPWSTSFGRVSFILLFLILIIGPIMRIKKPAESSSPLATPWSWRGELGIWFTLMALAHFIIIIIDRPLSDLIKIGGSGFGLANLLGLVALFWALILMITSFGKIISFLNISSWKWLHSMTYVIFYLVSGHFIYFQFFSTYGEIGPDWFGYIAVTMAIIVMILQLVGFTVAVKKQKEKVVD